MGGAAGVEKDGALPTAVCYPFWSLEPWYGLTAIRGTFRHRSLADLPIGI